MINFLRSKRKPTEVKVVPEIPTKPKPHTPIRWNDETKQSYLDEPCPLCNARVLCMETCHTYPQTSDGKTTWMSCMPCSSAGDLYCSSEECEWEYTWGLNPRNPRSSGNELNRPSWLIGDWPY